MCVHNVLCIIYQTISTNYELSMDKVKSMWIYHDVFLPYLISFHGYEFNQNYYVWVMFCLWNTNWIIDFIYWLWALWQLLMIMVWLWDQVMFFFDCDFCWTCYVCVMYWLWKWFNWIMYFMVIMDSYGPIMVSIDHYWWL